MLRLITRPRSVTNSPPALLASTAPGASAPLIGEPTPLTEDTLTTSQVPISLTSSVSVQPLNARRPKGSACSLEQADEGLGRGDEGLCWAHERPCMSYTDV
ncbi:hypothetical protein ACFX15_012501 [Malus domestica]